MPINVYRLAANLTSAERATLRELLAVGTAHRTDADKPSCVAASMTLRTESHGDIEAGEIYARLVQGETVTVWSQWSAGPVSIKAMPTRTSGRRIRLADGRFVELTDGHVVPLGELADLEGERVAVERVSAVDVGDVVSGVEVVGVDLLGEIDAIRVIPAEPCWLTTADGIVVGSRWHEVYHGLGLQGPDGRVLQWWDERSDVHVYVHPSRPSPVGEEAGAEDTTRRSMERLAELFARWEGMPVRAWDFDPSLYSGTEVTGRLAPLRDEVADQRRRASDLALAAACEAAHEAAMAKVRGGSELAVAIVSRRQPPRAVEAAA